VPETAVIDAFGCWDLEAGRLRPDILIEGSPERCDYRTVIEDRTGQAWIIERIFPNTREAKLRICGTLEYLDQQGMPGILPYRRTSLGEFLAETSNGQWLLRPFLPGTDLPRPAFLRHGWRGQALAGFLIRLREASARLPFFQGHETFALEPYIRQLLDVIWDCKPGVGAEVQPVLEHLEQAFFPLCPSLPTAFCHGDYHPVNVIWTPDGIGAVIDWEFTGPKPELYDVANLLGCAGFENPSGLRSEMAEVLIMELKEAGFASEQSWQSLTDLILALRFGWLSEWLRKKDQEMLELELVYMNLILEHRDQLTGFFLDGPECRP
jgi:homoserine kinase type II